MYRLYERCYPQTIPMFTFNTLREAEEARKYFQEGSNSHYYVSEISYEALDAELRHNANIFSATM